MAIKDKPKSKPNRNVVTDIKTALAIARYETFRKQVINRPSKSPKR